MSYFRNNRRGLSGLGGVENCGADQVFDPNVEAFGIKGQCMPRANYQASQLVNPNAYPGVVKTSGGDSGGGFLSSLIAGLTGAASANTGVVPPAYYPPPSTGMSTTTKLVLAGGGALLLIAVLKNR